MAKRITSILFLLIIVFWAIMNASPNKFLKPIIWQSIYGYSHNTLSKDATYSEKVIFVENNMEKLIEDSLPKYYLLEWTGIINKLFSRKLIYDAEPVNNVVKMNNGQLTFVQVKVRDTEIKKRSKSIIELNNWLEKKDINFLYVQAPNKILPYENQLPSGVKDYSNKNTDKFLAELKNSNVDFFDLRKVIQINGLDGDSAFFKTDHHWKPETALISVKEVCKELNDRYDFKIDETIFNESSYNFQVEKKWFLGSLGKRVGRLYAGIDDFTVITPKFKTKFNFEIPEYNVKKSGTFEQTMFDKNQLMFRDYYNLNPYAGYTGGDWGLNLIENKFKNEKRILVVRDSFGCAFTPFLALGCKYLDIIDLRHYKDGTLKEYINKTNPDVVIMLYNPGRLNAEPEMYTF